MIGLTRKMQEDTGRGNVPAIDTYVWEAGGLYTRPYGVSGPRSYMRTGPGGRELKRAIPLQLGVAVRRAPDHYTTMLRPAVAVRDASHVTT